jgi:hypothetical protein
VIYQSETSNAMKLSLFMPMSFCCSYCLKLDAVLKSIYSKINEDKWKISKEKVFCGVCLELIATSIKSEQNCVLDIKVPILQDNKKIKVKRDILHSQLFLSCLCEI